MNLIATDNVTAIIGLGKSGMSCARFLAAQGKSFFAMEENSTAQSVLQFKTEFPHITLITGELTFDALKMANRLIVSPGISLEKPALVMAKEHGIDIGCDIDIFAENTQVPIVAITGSNAKSTVTSLVGEMVKNAGIAVGVGGNIGTPALSLLMDGNDYKVFVLELSSFQLERMKPINAEVACLLNISPDHMDRYEGLAQYHAAKHRVFMGCKTAVFNRGDALTTPLLPDATKKISFGMDRPDFKAVGVISLDGEEHLAYQFNELMPVDEINLLGRHNIENSAAAIAIGLALHLPMASMLNTLRVFKGLPHRCEKVAVIDDVLYVNDSKGTNIGATVAAINGFATKGRKSIVLLAGGVGKGADFSLLAKEMSAVKKVIIFGEDGPKIEAALLNANVNFTEASTLEDAVEKARDAASKGDVVLFSPACASFDMFQGYAHRGECFVTIVNAIKTMRREAI